VKALATLPSTAVTLPLPSAKLPKARVVKALATLPSTARATSSRNSLDNLGGALKRCPKKNPKLQRGSGFFLRADCPPQWATGGLRRTLPAFALRQV
jgi:hypothetical protein